VIGSIVLRDWKYRAKKSDVMCRDTTRIALRRCEHDTKSLGALEGAIKSIMSKL
jgi:hypothetical protein